MFTTEGNIPVKILAVKFAEPKFSKDPNAFDICVQVQHREDPAQTDWWRGECSNDYGKGAVSSFKQIDLTMQTLEKIGFDGKNLEELPAQIVGKETVAWVKKSEPNAEGKVFFNVRGLGGGSGNEPEAISADEFSRRLNALKAPEAGSGSGQARSSASGNAHNPFA